MINSHKEIEQLLQKMPEGILIVDLEGKVKFMNTELASVLPFEDIDSYDALQQKVFSIYIEGETIEDTTETSKRQKTADKLRTLDRKNCVCLQDMIDDGDWNMDFDHYYELSLQLSHESAATDENSRIITQIRKQEVMYMNKPAKMLVIRNITFIIEFEKVKNEGRY